MAITQQFAFDILMAGDGSSTSFTVDMAQQFEALTISPKVPSRVLNGTTTSLFSTSVAVTLNDQFVTITFGSAPVDAAASNAGFGTVHLVLGF